jgi:repressor LexA
MGLLEEKVRDTICDRYGSVKAFADDIGIPSRTLYSALSKGLDKTSLSTIVPVCEKLGLRAEDVFHGRFVPTPDKETAVLVPFFEYVTARKSAEPEAAEEFHPISSRLHAVYPKAFLMRVKGDSMNRLMPAGSLALVSPCAKAEVSNLIYVVAIDGHEAAIRIVEILNNGLRLSPYSNDPTFQKVVLDYNNPDSPPVHVLGRVVWFCSDVSMDAIRNP